MVVVVTKTGTEVVTVDVIVVSGPGISVVKVVVLQDVMTTSFTCVVVLTLVVVMREVGPGTVTREVGPGTVWTSVVTTSRVVVDVGPGTVTNSVTGISVVIVEITVVVMYEVSHEVTVVPGRVVGTGTSTVMVLTISVVYVDVVVLTIVDVSVVRTISVVR